MGFGDTLCKQGKTTGWTCGNIVNFDVRPASIPGAFHYIEVGGAGMNCAGGDSGGPFVVLNTWAAGTMWGCRSTSPPTGIFSAINYIQADMNVTVRLG